MGPRRRTGGCHLCIACWVYHKGTKGTKALSRAGVAHCRGGGGGGRTRMGGWHGTPEGRGCAAMAAVAVTFAVSATCPMSPKPSCKHCPSHCYHPTCRARIREVMKFSGRRLVMTGRLDLLFHVLFQATAAPVDRGRRGGGEATNGANGHEWGGEKSFHGTWGEDRQGVTRSEALGSGRQMGGKWEAGGRRLGGDWEAKRRRMGGEWG